MACWLVLGPVAVHQEVRISAGLKAHGLPSSAMQACLNTYQYVLNHWVNWSNPYQYNQSVFRPQGWVALPSTILSYVFYQQLESQYLSGAHARQIFPASATQFASGFVKAAAADSVAAIGIFFINVCMFTRLICFTSLFRQAQHRSLWVFSSDKRAYKKHIKLDWRIDITLPLIILFV